MSAKLLSMKGCSVSYAETMKIGKHNAWQDNSTSSTRPSSFSMQSSRPTRCGIRRKHFVESSSPQEGTDNNCWTSLRKLKITTSKWRFFMDTIVICWTLCNFHEINERSFVWNLSWGRNFSCHMHAFHAFIFAKPMKLLMDGMIHPLILEALNEDSFLILCLLIGKY